jgi:hypothetical protein
MAENLNDKIKSTQKEIDAADANRLKSLAKIEEAENRIASIQADKYLPGKKKLIEVQKQLIELEKQSISNSEKVVSQETKRLTRLERHKAIQKDTTKEFNSFAKSYKNLEPDIKKQLELDKTKGQAYTLLNAQMAKERAIAKNSDGAALERANKRLEVMGSLSSEMMAQAEEADRAQMELSGAKEIDFKLREIKLLRERGEITKAQEESIKRAIHYTEKLEKRTEALYEIAEKQHEVFHAVPHELSESVKGAFAFGKTLMNAGMAAAPLLLVVTALAMAVHAFVELDKEAADYQKTTGMTAKQTKHLAHQAHEVEVAYRGIGVELKNVFDVANSLANEFSDVSHFSTQTLGALSAVTAVTGITAENAAKVQSVFQNVAGVSAETAASLQMQVSSLAQQAGVSPKEVLEDIADSAEITSKFFKGDVQLLKQQVIQAHRLGTDLKTVAAVSEKLLDFETGIEEELVAATFVGGQFNLSRARALAMEGKLVEAQEETLSQIQRSGDFRKKDYFTQKQLAAAAGMEVSEINKQLGMQERLAHLGEKEKKLAMQAVEAGLDTTDLNDEQLKQKISEFATNQKIMGQLDTMMTQFKAIAATVGGALSPLLEAIVPIMTILAEGAAWIFNSLNKVPGLLPGLIGGFTALYLLTKRAAIASTVKAIAEIFAGNAKLGPIGIVTAGIAAGALFSAMGKAKATDVGDVMSPAGGRTQISTKEGGLLNLSQNDDVVAAPNAISALENAKNLGALSSIPMVGAGAGAGAINILVDEMKKMRQEFSSKSTDVYMDSSKVTSNLKRVGDKSNRNNFALA